MTWFPRVYTPLEKQAALIELLRLPDPVDLPKRGYHYTQTRDPKRSADLIKRDLGTAHVQHVRQTFGSDISCVVSFRRSAKAATVRPFAKVAR